VPVQRTVGLRDRLYATPFREPNNIDIVLQLCYTRYTRLNTKFVGFENGQLHVMYVLKL